MGLLLRGHLGQEPTGGFDFSPTILGDSLGLDTDWVVEAEADDESFPNASASADTDIWIVAEGGEIYIRVAANANGLQTDTAWYDPDAVDQGAPDTNRIPGTDVFSLGEYTGVTVNIYTVRAPTPDGLTHTKIGTFTDDDKLTFFALTDDVDYGWSYDAEANDPPGAGEVDNVIDYAIHQFTFRKAGYNDYTISMSQQVAASATEAEEEP